MEADKTKIKSFTDLNTWKEGHKLVLTIYKITDQFPQKEVFGLTNQMRRSAVSVTSNVAEGFSRLTELQNQLLIARDIGYIKEETFQETAHQIVVVNKLLNGLKRIKNTRY